MLEHILFVDDDALALDAMRRALRAQGPVWNMTFLDDSRTAWQRLQNEPFHAVVADVCMPHLSGLELLARMQQSPQLCDVPVVVVTGSQETGLKHRALEAGAADLLNKPIDEGELLARLRSVLRLKSYQDQLQRHNRALEDAVRARTIELSDSRLEIIWRLAKTAEHRECEAGRHVVRVACISRLIAEELGLRKPEIETLFLAAPLHDLGKIGIPDAILLKRGPLSPGEWAVMRQHCLIGARILSDGSRLRAAYMAWRGDAWSEADAAGENPILSTAARVALAHHERWDGRGYPRGLRGEAIPREARIVAIADAFDALTSERPYKPALSEAEALSILEEEADGHFDPAAYQAFCARLDDVRGVRRQLADDAIEDEAAEESADAENLVCR